MAELRPFAGVRYDTTVAGPLEALLAPPYDVISPTEQAALYAASPYNIIRIEYGQGSPDDNESENRYTRAVADLRAWLASGSLAQDAAPSFYLIRHSFEVNGRARSRRELLAAVRLEEWDRMVVRPHELTLAGPKVDRLNLMRAVSANTSPIYSLYPDGDGQLSRLLDTAETSPPAVEAPEWKGAGFKLWVISDPATVSGIQNALVESPLYIADGHHRYETALAYQREQRAADPAPTPDAPYNSVMMSLTAAEDPGLRILPLHRLVRGLNPETRDGLLARLSEIYDVKMMSLPAPQDIEDMLAEEGGSSPAFALAGLPPDQLALLTPRDVSALRSAVMPDDWSDGLRGLDVALLHRSILTPLLDRGPLEADLGLLAFSHDTAETLHFVASGEYQIAFLVNPTRPDQVMAVADAQEKMPQKSTFFYPKLPTGLVLRLLAGGR
ncbi:MAG: DUF1015 domain-containing protein [Chloroflexi bacterium]|nr:DUF1015 domain-containing protein [Chloroflexota bacterium]